MAWSMMGSRGDVRFRTIGKRAGRGPRGVVGARSKPKAVEPTVVRRTHKKLYEESKKGFLSKVAAKAKNLFRRGAK
jgi:hypothetical protein